jgi:hypothetical protein
MTKARTNADNVTADIAGITAGTGITGGGTSGTVTITNDMATTIAAKGDLLAGTANDAYSALSVGSNNLVLTADSAQATGLKWAAPDPLTTKGDLFTYSTVEDRLPVGTNGQVLTAASGQTTGLQWTTISTAPTVASQRIATSQSTTNESTFIDLATAGPTVTLTTGTKAMIIITCETSQITNGAYGLVGFTVSGATTIAADANQALKINTSGGLALTSAVFYIDNLTAGSNTFTLKYRGSGGSFTHSFKNREIIVMNLGS